MTEELRASKITIEIPKPTSVPWVHITVNKMFIEDGELIQNEPRFDHISEPLTTVGLNMFTFMDPVLGQEVTVSGYGLAQAITSYVSDEFVKRYGEGKMHG